ncbi:MAG: DUF6607 family protein [Luteolibacter sp.]|uniref:DUF6607 family protein n=1 Tax=Luteolibacter sp. TaxID=1962973 RepID=UPI0032654D3D
MQRRLALILLASFATALAAPPEEDRKAILSMAGNFKVTFDFKETFPIAPGYTPLSKDYHEEAVEVVTLVEDTPERIALQHLLVVGKEGKSRVIKHWAQVWTWQDTRILDYAGSDGKEVWLRPEITAEHAKGQWSELVTSVDDTPRYESLGRWTHEFGESYWTSEPTRRPLPRREYEVRDDYDYLMMNTRYSLTQTGWAHSQDSRKVVDRGGKKYTLSRETGLNQYSRTDDPLAVQAIDWWKENATVWNSIRNFWIDAGQQPGPTFSFELKKDGMTLKKKFDELEKAKPAPEAVTEALTPYLSVSR